MLGFFFFSCVCVQVLICSTLLHCFFFFVTVQTTTMPNKIAKLRRLAEEPQLNSRARSVDACNQLADAYWSGKGVQKDAGEAVKWLIKASEMKHARAPQYNLGVSYEEGIVAAQSPGKAFKWYKKAAHQGHAGAQGNLEACYDQGAGVAKSHEIAIHWYQKAADQGCASAQCSVGFAHFFGRGVAQS